jgi:hypothetical protein
MHPTAVLLASELRSVAQELQTATAAAAAAGVSDVPAVLLRDGDADRLYLGERALEPAALALGGDAL